PSCTPVTFALSLHDALPISEVGRFFLGEDPDHPGSEATAVSEALEVVYSDPESRFAMGAFANHVLLHQTVIGLEAREQLELVDRDRKSTRLNSSHVAISYAV